MEDNLKMAGSVFRGRNGIGSNKENIVVVCLKLWLEWYIVKDFKHIQTMFQKYEWF